MSSASSSERSRAWPWFVAWFAAGAGCALGVAALLSIGIVVLPLAAGATVFLASRRTSAVGITGLVSGAGLPLLYIAFLNRDGPGDVCRATHGGSSCTQEWNPWPIAAAGIILVACGVVAYFWSNRIRTHAHPRRA